MRIREIEALREKHSSSIQELPSGDISNQLRDHVTIAKRETWKRQAMRQAAGWLARWCTARSAKILSRPLSFSYNAMFVGERFADDYSIGRLHTNLKSSQLDVLLPGCYLGGADAQHWLRRGIRSLHGFDVYCLDTAWRRIVPNLEKAFGIPVHFRQANLEQLPYEDSAFDLVHTRAVLEHVRNISAMTKETYRVLKPGGRCWHSFGPLYTTFGGDHCCSAFGTDHGYDHILLTEEDYRCRIADQAFFDTQDDPNLPFWALNDQFSFLPASRYLKIFAERFQVESVVVKLSDQGIEFRAKYPDRWQAMLSAGINEEDLLVKSLAVILSKPFT